MKKITLALTLLLVTSALAFAGPFSLSGSSTLEWGYAGTITDNSTNFEGEIPTGNLFTDDSGEHDLGPNEFTLTLEVADEDGMVIVAAESTLDLEDWDVTLDTEEEDAYDFIEFPNVVPGVLGIWLGAEDDAGTSVTASGSSTESPELVATITPVDGLTAKLGFVMAQGTLDYMYLLDSWAYATYTDIALSIFAEYEAMLGDEDSITVGVGTVYDTAWGKGMVTSTDGISSGDELLGLTKEVYQALTVVANDVALDADGSETYGYASMPLGAAIDVAMGDLTAGIDFQARLVQGSDTENLDNDTVMEMRTFEMPMYAAVDVAYELAAGDMTITPSVNFKYSNDFWKWGANDDDPLEADEYEYDGLVSGADYVGRPMSVNVGVDVDGIAGMIDLSLSAGLGFGDGAYSHGASLDDTFGILAPPVQDADGNYAPTLATLLADTQDGADAEVADINDKELNASTDAMEISIGLTIAPPMVAGLTITNDFSIINDGLGFLGYDDSSPPVLFGEFMNEITNDLVVEYDLMVGDVVGCTFFGKLMYEQIVPQTEFGESWEFDPILAINTEQASKATMSYELGVKATVSF